MTTISSMIGTGSIAENLARVEESIQEACRRSGRSREEITLVAVSKTFSPSAIDEALAAGVYHIGENRVQELREKVESVAGRPRWHLIGHLQSNKAKDAARMADVIQTIDGLPLAERVGRAAIALHKTIDVMVEINIGREARKSGVDADDAEPLVAAIREVPGIRMTGLMAIPPLADAAATRAYFRAMRDLGDRLERALGVGTIRDLSFGMSDDFGIAIEEGANVIRIGRAIFGGRL